MENVQSGSSASRVTTRDFLTVMFRRKWIVILLPIVTLGVVTYVNLSAPSRYSSFARILLRRGSHENALEANLTILPREEELASQVEIARSVAVIKRAQGILDQRPGRKIQIEPWNANAGVVGESNVVDVTYESTDPEACPAVAEALGTAFMEFHSRAFSVPTRADFFAHAADSLLRNIEKLRDEKEEVLRKGGNIEPGEGMRVSLQMMMQDQNLLEQVRNRRVALEAELASMKQLEAHTDLDFTYEPTTETLNESWVVDLKRNLQELRMRLDESRSKFSGDNPQVLSLKEQVDQLQAQLKREVRGHRLLRQQALQIARAQEKMYSHSLDSLRSELDRYPASSVRIEEVTALIGINQELYKNMRDRQDRAVVATNASPDWTATLLVPASLAVRLNKRDYVRIALAPMLALAIAIGLAFFVESLDHTLKSVREVEDVLGLPVVASVREVK